MIKSVKRMLLAAVSVMLVLFAFSACTKNEEEEKLLLGVQAESSVEVGTVFKPTVTVAEGSSYELIVTGVPTGATTPEVKDNSFVPDKTGSYNYKIVVSKEGATSEEHTGKVQSVDTTAPMVTGEKNEYNITRGETLVFADMVANLTVSDNYDGQLSGLKFSKILKGDEAESVAEGAVEYTFAQAGEYKVIFTVSDSSANETVVEIPVTVAGFDVSQEDIVLYAGDTLEIPEYTILPEGEGSVKIYLDGTEIDLNDLPVFNEEGTHTLKLCYFMSYNQSEDPDETAEINVNVKAIEISLAVDAEGREIGFAGKVPQPVVNAPEATVTITLQKPGEEQGAAVTPLQDITYDECGYYVYTVTAVNKEVECSKTVSVYIRAKNELISFEDIRGGSLWDGTGATDTEAQPSLSEEQVKYGKYSLKMVLPQNKLNEVVYNTGMPVGKAYNTVSFWIYSTAETQLRLGLAQNDDSNWWLLDPNGSESFSVAVGWNQISLMIANPAGNGQIGTIRVTNIGISETTLYLDAMSFSSDLYILKKTATENAVTNQSVDLNDYFEIVGISDQTVVEITAEKGSISLREYTTPKEACTDTVTVRVSEEGKTTRELKLTFNVISVSFTVPDNYDLFYEVNTDIGVKQPVQAGALNPVVTIKVITESEEFTVDGDVFRVAEAGWVSVVYTLTCDNEEKPVTVEKEFYVRETGEVITFEDYQGSGKNYDNTNGSSADIVAPVIDEALAYSGKQSMKFVLGGGQQTMLNYQTSEFMPKPASYNTIRIALHSDIDTAVRFGIGQNGDPWWFIDPNGSEVYQVKVGWNEIAITVPEVKGSGDVACLALTNCGTESGVFHMDSIRFLTEIGIAATGGTAQAIVGAEVDLSEFVVVTNSENYTLTVTVADQVIDGTKYIFEEEGDFSVVYTVKDNVSGIEKSCAVVFKVKGIILTVADYAHTVLNTSVAVLESGVEGAVKNISVKVVKPQGGELALSEGETFTVDEGGWYKVIYTQTDGENVLGTLEKTFYVGYENELMSFENISRNGQGISANIGTPTSSVEVSSEQAYFGEYSLKFTNINNWERAQVTYDGNAESGTAPIISDNNFNKIKLWVYSESAVSVTIGIQGGGDSDAEWGWLTSTDSVITLQAGWQELTLDRNAMSGSKYISSIFVDKRTEGTDGVAESIYIDCIRFVNE